MPELIQNADGALLLAIQGLRLDVLDPLVIAYTHLGDAGLLWMVLSAVMLLFRPTRKAGAAALLAMGLGLLLTNLTVKPLVSRPRPWLDVEGLIPLIAEHDPHSFPSGHTCAAFAAAMVWVRGLPKGWMKALSVGMAVCMGLSRLYVGVHYPIDVLCGALIGSLCAWAAWQLLKRTEKRI